ncbi:hypothetical protein [Streptomyces apricus]|uniref:Uncharacterized protein n=1 Tax=Streptomyces apricus TaxID=1828112 RepID=A0A5A9ZSB5_9ACTN|nr:hypothetical protein [Streptomyces apricus]KAA0920117.1 hypothetical protein FGF04_37885 [Streptomyces apricus]
MRLPLIIRTAPLFGAAALTGAGLLFAGTARADDQRTFDCQLLRVFADHSLEGYSCGEPTTYDGPGKVRYLNGAGGYTCRNISARPDAGDSTTTTLKATGCTSGTYPGYTTLPMPLAGTGTPRE